MSQTLQIDAQYVASKLKEWSAKSGKDVQELKEQFAGILAKTTGRTDQVRFKKALNTMKRSFETSMNSNAVAYKTIILGVAAPFDAVKKRRADIEMRYQASPSELISTGEVRLNDDNSYTMIDIKHKLPNGKENPFYGKPIQHHSFMTNCTAVVMKPNEDKKWMPANIVLRGDLSTEKVPLYQEMELRLNGQFNGEQGRYNLNSSKGATNFSSLGKSLSAEELAIIVEQVYDGKFVLAGNLKENLEQTKSDPQRFVVTEGIVNSKFLKEDGGLSTIKIGDESFDLGETMTCFVDGNIRHIIENLEEGDNVTVIGRTSWGKGYDFETKKKTDEDVLMMNLYGIFTRPE